MPVSPRARSLTVALDFPPGLSAEQAVSRWRSTVGPVLAEVCDAKSPPCGLVLGGELLAWMDAHAGDAMRRVREAIEVERVELVGLPSHVPIFELVPGADWLAQLQAHAAFLLARFGVRPAGAWLPWGVWDPVMPAYFYAANLRWCLLPAGALGDVAREAPDHAAFWTEREGRALRLLPSVAGVEGRPLPGWMQQVFRAGEAEAPEARARLRAGFGRFVGERLAPPSAVVDAASVAVRVYLTAWAPRAVGSPVSRRLLEPPERDRLHKATLRASRQVDRLNAAERSDPTALVQARRYLHRAQHGALAVPEAPGGLEDPAARRRAWRDLLRAEQVARAARGAAGRTRVERVEGRGDGQSLWRARTAGGIALVDPALGGALTEWSVWDPARALLGVPDGGPGFALSVLAPDANPEFELPQRPQRGAPWQVIAAAEGPGAGIASVQLGGTLPEAEGALWCVRSWQFAASGALQLTIDAHHRGHDPVHLRLAVRVALELSPAETRLERAPDGSALGLHTADFTLRLRASGGAVLHAHPLRDAAGRAQGVGVLLVRPVALWDGGRERFGLDVEWS